ncbi:TPA_asm: phage head morphogenesis protein [Salmonella enterica subsp. houtenae serovar 45:g,z51:-]|uniref:Phage head morphogenesis protein n=1 Tax=Salmonella enterica subsp. houtenae serovar 45:g,z51:- TaxID=1967611 RepID=A0A736RK06_SALHO|nr:phage head morphogenesis protein [Salmonella enterica subsp. houtenae str. CFSAN000557]HAE7766813.1 phage head morphogenesis protein [Salmonella enterica subsp. houtenae serovar 45:g,z51:-]
MPKADVDLGYAIGLKPEEAIKYFESKGYAIGFNWHDVDARAHATSFTVAGVLKQDILEDIRQAQQAHIDNGGTLRDFERQLTPVLTRKGWLADKARLVADDDGVLEGKQLTPRRLRTIFETNMQAAYGAGRYAEQMANAEFRPIWERVAVMDSHTRPRHAALNGFTARYDDPVWQFMYPPDGYHCRCRIRARTEADAERLGIQVRSWEQDIVTVQQAWGPNDTRDVKALRFNGELYTPDAGFGHNPGQGWLSSLGQRLMDKAATATPRIATQAVSEVLSEPAVMDAVTDDIRRWVDAVSVRQNTRGDLKRVGAVPPELLSRLEENGVQQPVAFSIHEEDVRQAPGPMWSELPALLRQRGNVWLDSDSLVWLLPGQTGVRAVRGIPADDSWRLSLVNGGATVSQGDVLTDGAKQLQALAP